MSAKRPHPCTKAGLLLQSSGTLGTLASFACTVVGLNSQAEIALIMVQACTYVVVLTWLLLEGPTSLNPGNISC